MQCLEKKLGFFGFLMYNIEKNIIGYQSTYSNLWCEVSDIGNDFGNLAYLEETHANLEWGCE